MLSFLEGNWSNNQLFSLYVEVTGDPGQVYCPTFYLPYWYYQEGGGIEFEQLKSILNSSTATNKTLISLAGVMKFQNDSIYTADEASKTTNFED